MSVMCSQTGPVRGFPLPVSLLGFAFLLLIPELNLRWVLCQELFSELTPEESDAFTTPDENPPVSDIPGGNNPPFLTGFAPF